MRATPVRGSGVPGPYSGDERYWFHLLPKEAISSVDTRPEQRVLVGNPLLPIDMDLFHSWLFSFLQWIPTVQGDWASLPDSRIFVDAKGATTAKGIFEALIQLFSAGPPRVELPGPRVSIRNSRARSETVLRLSYSQQELVTTFQQLARFAAHVEMGTHVLFCSYWLERAE